MDLYITAIKNKIFILVTVFSTLFVNTLFAAKSSSEPNRENIPSQQSVFLSRIQSLTEELVELDNLVESEKTNLLQLKNEVLDENEQAKLIIKNNQDVDASYVLIESQLVVDGKKVATLDKGNESFPVYSHLVTPGTHQISVKKLYRKTEVPAMAGMTLIVQNEINVKTVLANTTYVDVVTLQKYKAMKSGKDNIEIKFDVKMVPNPKETKVSLTLESVMSNDEKKGDKNAELMLVVDRNLNPSLMLIGREVQIDNRKVELISPSLVTDEGQVIFDDVSFPEGRHQLKVALRYRVGGRLSKIWNTKILETKYSQKFSTKSGRKTTISLKGIGSGAKITLPAGSEEIIEIVELLDKKEMRNG